MLEKIKQNLLTASRGRELTHALACTHRGYFGCSLTAWHENLLYPGGLIHILLGIAVHDLGDSLRSNDLSILEN